MKSHTHGKIKPGGLHLKTFGSVMFSNQDRTQVVGRGPLGLGKEVSIEWRGL